MVAGYVPPPGVFAYVFILRDLQMVVCVSMESKGLSGRPLRDRGRGVYPPSFSEVVGNAGLILAGVQESAKRQEPLIENKEVSGSCFWRNSKKCEVAENTGVRGFLGWAEE